MLGLRLKGSLLFFEFLHEGLAFRDGLVALVDFALEHIPFLLTQWISCLTSRFNLPMEF